MKMNPVVRLQGRVAGLWIAAALVSGLGTGGAALGQDYPSRSVTLIVNFAPGAGALNLMVRALANDASKDLKQAVVVDYKAGAGGNIGAQFVAGFNPDGYTLLAAVDTTLTVNPSVYAKMRFDADKAFAPVSTLATFSQLLVVNHDALPVKSFAEFVVHAKTKLVQYASAEAGYPGFAAEQRRASRQNGRSDLCRFQENLHAIPSFHPFVDSVCLACRSCGFHRAARTYGTSTGGLA